MSDAAFAEVRADADERPQLHAVRVLVDGPDRPVTVVVGDEIVELPRSLVQVLLLAAHALEDGDTVAVVNEEAEVSPSEAARLLGVSRQYVDRLIATGVLPARRLPDSSYRKVPVRAALAHRRDRERKQAAIREIVGHATDAGLDY